MDSGVISVDEYNIIKTFNKKSEQIFQVKREDVIGKKADKVLPLMIGNQSIYQLGLQEKKKIETEIELNKNNVKKVLEFNTSLLSEENDDYNGMVILVRDVSQIKALSEEINRNKRLASLGKLSSGIAHEIRNPLSSIRGLAQFLHQSFDDSDERKNDLNIILKEVDRLNLLVNNVLDFSKNKRLILSNFSLNKLIEEIIYLIQLENNKKKINFQFVTNNNNYYVDGDRDKIKQAIMNVVLNSIQAINISGDIVIMISGINFKNKENIKITITDNGTGIEKEDLSHIFDPFFTNRDNGHGLGLSISYNIIEMHGGIIRVESEKNRGTKVDILLPIRSKEKNE
jgi:two-component system sensor histidine kinase HydH